MPLKCKNCGETHLSTWPCRKSQVPEPAESSSAEASHQVPTLDLDQLSWESIKRAAMDSPWMPKEYMMNDWVSDVCKFLSAVPDGLKPENAAPTAKETWHYSAERIWQDNEIESVITPMPVEREQALRIIEKHNESIKRLAPPPSPWIRTAERKPTKEDCDIHELVLAQRKDEGCPEVYDWSDVARFFKQYDYWMPIPSLPWIRKEKEDL